MLQSFRVCCRDGSNELSFTIYLLLAGFEPLVDIPGTPGAWTLAWETIGSCEGTTAPTPADEIVALDADGSPTSYLGVCNATEYSLGTQYGPGEQALVCEGEGDACTVYQCAMDMPNPSGWCGQDGYQPGEGQGTFYTSYGHSPLLSISCPLLACFTAWTMAWTELGYCTTTARPTANPTASPTNGPTESPSSGPTASPTVSQSPSTSQQPSQAVRTNLLIAPILPFATSN